MNFHVKIIKRIAFGILLLASIISLAGCAYLQPVPITEPTITYIASGDGASLATHSPIFLIEDSTKSYNLIGTPTAELNADDKERVYVNSVLPMIYTLKNSFETERGSYTNLYYRIHFEKSAFEVIPFNVSAGSNTGLIVVVTLNQSGDPLLYTTVHTCGCYLAFIPTSFMPSEAYPLGWSTKGQRVYGEKLPGILSYPERATGYRTVITLRSGTHRVKGLHLRSTPEIQERYLLVATPTQSMVALEELPMEDGSTTSFFETEGLRRDYVKGSNKPWEKLFISWWVLKWRVGEDKIFSPDRPTKTVFFTSMKFWDRNESDMENFVRFLRYWGWGL